MIKFVAKLTVAALFAAGTVLAADSATPFVGNWAITLPEGAPGWLGVTQNNGQLTGSLLWIGGSVTPLDSVSISNQSLVCTRVRSVDRKDNQGKIISTERLTDNFAAQLDGDNLKFVALLARNGGSGVDKKECTGKRIPPPPSAPDLAKVNFGNAISLFNGKDLTGWRLTNPKALNGWIVADGLLINRIEQEEGKPHKNYGNLRTDREFEDFNLTLETRVPKGGNSGVYLRGVYEVQVMDSYGKPLDPHNMGALYSRIKPGVSAEKPAGEWQSLDITLVARHLTVILNGKKIIDNQPVLGVTGGALTADEFKPGPIYLQGDHTGIEYRNLVLRPVAK